MLNKNKAATAVSDWLKAMGGFELCDFDNLPIRKKNPEDENEEQKFLPKKGFVKIVPCNPRKMVGGANMQTAIYRKVVWDRDYGICYGQPMGVSGDSGIQFKAIRVEDEREFNLSKKSDRDDLYILLHTEDMENGPRSKGKAKYRMIDPEKAAKDYVQKRDAMRDADEIVRNLSNAMGLTELSDFGILFGINPMQSAPVIQQQLYEKADTDPVAIVKRWEDPDRKVWSAVKKAVMYQVIERKPDGFYYGGLAMGASEANCVNYIKMNPELSVTLNDNINTKMGKAPISIPISKKSEDEVLTPKVEKPKMTKKAESVKQEEVPADEFGK
jgi:hypothetical protein